MGVCVCVPVCSGGVTFRREDLTSTGGASHLECKSFIYVTASCFVVAVANCAEVMSVVVQEDDMKYGKSGFVVVLNFESGYSIGLTEVATTDHQR